MFDVLDIFVWLGSLLHNVGAATLNVAQGEKKKRPFKTLIIIMYL